MNERTTVEKRLDVDSIDEGRIRLTDRELDILGLPSHSVHVSCRVGERTLGLDWNAALRHLKGEALEDLLQLEATVNGMVRLHRLAVDGHDIELEIVAPEQSRLVLPGFDDFRFRHDGPAAGPAKAAAAKKRPPKRQRREDRFRVRAPSEFDWHGEVGIHRQSVDKIVGSIAANGWDEQQVFELRFDGEQLIAVNDFTDLLAPDLAKVDKMDHQVATAARVLGPLRGRAILADEVGLGKTIEAGLILKELALRGLIRKVLIICPATLRDQWREELEEKFDEEFSVIGSGDEPLKSDRVIMSNRLALLRRSELMKVDWDLVIIDEAHKGLGGPKTQALLRGLRPRYMLMLTATPVQNDLLELYRLVETLRPGTFRSERAFKLTYMNNSDPRTPRDPVALRKLVASVMVRTTRSQAGLDNVARLPTDHAVALSADERHIYDLCVEVLRSDDTQGAHFRQRALTQRLCYSMRALGSTARRMAQAHPNPSIASKLAEIADRCIDFPITARQKKMLEIVRQWTNDGDKGKVLIFTQHTDTLDDLVRVLGEHGIESVAFHGGLSQKKKNEAIADFRSRVAVMVSSDAGAEGLNLQFANCVLNYDLPWNPMRIEQRIGRVHRVTQTRDVHVANLYALDTIDEHVYRILHDKLRMFELLFGQVTTVLGELNLEDRKDKARTTTFESKILDALLERSDASMQRKLADLGTRVEKAYEAAKDSMTGGQGSAWLSHMSHRRDLPGDQALELVPEAVARSDRHRQVWDFVSSFLAHIQATILHVDEQLADGQGTSSEVPAFVLAEVPEAWREALGGRETLALAFVPEAMQGHMEAELCAAGSDLVEEMVEALEECGDLVAAMPRHPEPQQTPWIAHHDKIQFSERTVVGPKTYAGTAIWRVNSSDAGAGDQVVDLAYGTRTKSRSRRGRRLLGDGESLPETMPAASELVDRLIDDSMPQLEELAQKAAEDFGAAEETERSRQVAHYQAQRDDLENQAAYASGTNRLNIELKLKQNEAALKNLIESTLATPKTEAYLRALTIEGQLPLVIEERWSTPSGEATIRTEWDPAEQEPPLYFDSVDRAIDVLDFCDDLHAVDHDDIDVCPTCTVRRCGVCPARARARRQCVICLVESCAACVPAQGRICRRCKVPELVEDRGVERHYSLNGGATLVVSSRTAVLLRPGGPPTPIYSDGGLSPVYERRLAAAATSLGVTGDTGVRFGDRPEEIERNDRMVGYRSQRETTWRHDRYGAGACDPFAAEALPPPPATLAGEATGFAKIAAAMRASAPFEPAGDIVVEQTLTEHWLEIDPARGILRRKRVAASGCDDILTEQLLELGPGKSPGELECGPFDDVSITVRRANHAVLIEAVELGQTISTWAIVPPEFLAETELALAALAQDAGLPDVVVECLPGDLQPLRFAEPRTARLEARSVAVVPRFEPVRDRDTVRVPSAYLETTAGDLKARDTPDATVIVADPGQAFTLPAASRSVLRPLHHIEETWIGAGRATVIYDHYGTGVARPPLPDGGTADDFDVDALGHLHRPADGWRCNGCTQQRCPECEGEIGECSTCGEHRCGYCTTGTWLRPCPVCEVESCSTCIPTAGATCTRCRSAELIEDRGYERLYALNGGATLLARGRSATLGLPGREPLSFSDGALVPPAAAARIAAVAATLDVDRDLGVRVGDIAPDIEPPEGAVAFRQDRSPLYRFDSNGSGHVESRALEALPRAARSQPAVSQAVVSLAAQLRRASVFAPPGDIVVDEALTARWLEIKPESGVIAVTRRIEPNGVDETASEVLEFRPADGRSLVAKPFDGVEVRASAANRAVLAEVVDTLVGLDLGAWLFVPQGLSGRGELALAGLARQLQKPECELLVRAADLAAVSHVEPSTGARLHRRLVSMQPVLEDPKGADDVTVTAEYVETLGYDLEDLGIPEATELVGIPGQLQPLVGAAPASFAVRPKRRISEIWEGHGTVEVEYEHVGGGLASPPMPDGSICPSDFEVDEAGHLHPVGHGWDCESCGEYRCRFCDDGEVTLCTCGRAACGKCRNVGGVQHEPVVCEACGDASCRDCRYVVSIEDCINCGSPTCAQCLNGGSCSTCRSLTPIEVHDLPAWISPARLDGLQLRSATDSNKVVIAAVGAVRREFLVLDRSTSSVRSWITLSAEMPPPTLELALGVRASSGDLSIKVTHVGKPSFSLEPGHQEIRRVERYIGEVALVEGDGERRVIADADLERPAGWPTLLSRPDLPSRPTALTDGSRRRSLEALVPARGHIGSLVRVEVTTMGLIEIATVDTQGLHARALWGEDEQRTTTPWESSAGSLSDLVSKWRPQPDAVVSAKSGAIEVAIARLRSHVLLLERSRESVRLRLFCNEPWEPESIAAAHALGLADSVRITGSVDDADWSPLNVGNGRCIYRQTSVVWRDVPEDVDIAQMRSITSKAMLPPVVVVPDVAGRAHVASSTLQAELQSLVGGAGSVRTMELGLDVVERWQDSDGNTAAVQHTLWPANPQAAVQASDSGEAASDVWLDRSGHLAEHVEGCRYCSTSTCSACADPVLPCDFCGIEVCGRCTSQPGRCPACISLAPVGAVRRLRHRLGKRAFGGRDHLHEVVFCTEGQEGWWSVDRSTGQRTLTPPAVWSLLEGLE